MEVAIAWARSGRGPSHTSISAAEATPPRPRPRAMRRAPAPGAVFGRSAERPAMRASVVFDIGASISFGVPAAEALQATMECPLHRGFGQAVLPRRLPRGKAFELGLPDQLAGALGKRGH